MSTNRLADRSRQPLSMPRNAKAQRAARAQHVPLIVSFAGDTPWPNPTVYCDPGKRYDWSCVAGVSVIIVARGATDIRHAASSILALTDVIYDGYPVLIDVGAREAACIVEGSPFALWPIRRGSALWQEYFRT